MGFTVTFGVGAIVLAVAVPVPVERLVFQITQPDLRFGQVGSRLSSVLFQPLDFLLELLLG